MLADGLGVDLGSASLTASSSTAPRPTRWSMTRAGTLPVRKPGTADLLADLLVRRVEAGLELLEGHLDGEPNPGRAQVLDGALHVRSPRSFRVLGRSHANTSRRAHVLAAVAAICGQTMSGWRDSNPRPLAPKASALPNCATPRRRRIPSLVGKQQWSIAAARESESEQPPDICGLPGMLQGVGRDAYQSHPEGDRGRPVIVDHPVEVGRGRSGHDSLGLVRDGRVVAAEQLAEARTVCTWASSWP